MAESKDSIFGRSSQRAKYSSWTSSTLFVRRIFWSLNLFYKRKEGQEPMVSIHDSHKLSSGWFVTVKTCSVLCDALLWAGTLTVCHALTCGSIKIAYKSLSFLFSFLSVTGALPPYPHHLLKKVDENFNFALSKLYPSLRRRRTVSSFKLVSHSAECVKGLCPFETHHLLKKVDENFYSPTMQKWIIN